jgi:hypothetical protein
MSESLNARFRQAVRRRGHFPTDQAALKVLDGHTYTRPDTAYGTTARPRPPSPPRPSVHSSTAPPRC